MSLVTQTPQIKIFNSYEDLEVGSSFTSTGRTITETDVLLFSALIAGFHNPIHHNVPWIKANTTYRDKLFPGPGVLSYAIGLLSATLAYRTILIGFLGLDKLVIHGPVYPGDTIIARSTVRSKRVTSKGNQGIVDFDIQVFNQDDKVVMTFKYKNMVRVDPPQPPTPKQQTV